MDAIGSRPDSLKTYRSCSALPASLLLFLQPTCNQLSVSLCPKAREMATMDEADRQSQEALHGGDIVFRVGMVGVLDQWPS